PDALAIAVIHLDLDGRTEFPALGQLRPVLLHLVWIGRGIGVGTLRVKPLTRHPRQCAGGSRDHHCRSKCMAHSGPPLSIPPRIASEHSHHSDPAKTPHSITSLARASRVGGTSRPSALAVLRLITVSNFTGACTGRSAGFSPLRMRST